MKIFKPGRKRLALAAGGVAIAACTIVGGAAAANASSAPAPKPAAHTTNAKPVVVECGPDLGNAEVQAALEIYVGIGAPDLALQFLAGDDLPVTRDQCREHLCRLRLQPHRRTVARQLAGRGVELENAEPCHPRY